MGKRAMRELVHDVQNPAVNPSAEGHALSLNYRGKRDIEYNQSSL